MCSFVWSAAKPDPREPLWKECVWVCCLHSDNNLEESGGQALPRELATWRTGCVGVAGKAVAVGHGLCWRTAGLSMLPALEKVCSCPAKRFLSSRGNNRVMPPTSKLISVISSEPCRPRFPEPCRSPHCFSTGKPLNLSITPAWGALRALLMW